MKKIGFILMALVLAVGLVVPAALAAGYQSGDKVTTTGPNTLAWTGQGATDGEVDEVDCEDTVGQGLYPDGFLHWIFTDDGGTTTYTEGETPYLVLNGDDTNKYYPTKAVGAFHFYTPYYTPDSSLTAVVSFNTIDTGNGAYNLVISHGCSGNGGETKGKICVEKFYDTDMDGIWDYPGESEIEGWEVKIYDDATPPNLVATLYTPDCIELEQGNYTVVETIPAGWVNTTVASVAAEVTPGSEESVQFGNIQLGRICVEKFYDANVNTTREYNEVELSDWEVKIYDDEDNLVDTLYTPDCSIWLYPGNYTVTETIPAGWVNTTPASVTVEVSAEMVEGDKEYDVEFGNIQLGRICVEKFYDADTDGVWDTSEVRLCTWEVKIYDDAGALVDTLSTPECSIWLYPGTYTVTETIPAGWVNTTPKSVIVEIEAGMVEGDKEYDVEFGNVCLGAGGGKTLGFWSNKNGQATINDGGTVAPELAMLSGLNLKNATGGNFDPTTYAQFRTWLLGASATNMAYMLSAQLAAMALNVEANLVNGNSLVYIPCIGFISVNNLMNPANAALGTDGYTPAGDANRAYQECLKNALDKANNNMNFVQATPCGYTCP